MKLTEEYKRQSTWRNWDAYIKQLPIDNQDTILDLGCSIGVVTKLLANKALRVIGIDNNPELIKEAIYANSAENINYSCIDLASINNQELPLSNGIWTSFVASYFPDFASILSNWLNFLKPNGWIAIVEMSDLFAHEPLSQFTRDTFKEYYERQRRNNMYDFEMGSKIKDFLINCGLSIVHEENKFDSELTFNGPAEPQILKAWECRFDRMVKFKEYLGEMIFHKIKKEFLDCLSNEKHSCRTIVKFIIAKNLIRTIE